MGVYWVRGQKFLIVHLNSQYSIMKLNFFQESDMKSSKPSHRRLMPAAQDIKSYGGTLAAGGGHRYRNIGSAGGGSGGGGASGGGARGGSASGGGASGGGASGGSATSGGVQKNPDLANNQLHQQSAEHIKDQVR